MPTTFETLYKKLNKAQKKAVDTIEGPVMVIAGPGTGKTSILTLRIANILRLTDTPANGILAITYTDAGVKAMRQKLRDVIGDRAHDVRIHTFHGFASSVISEYPDHFLHISHMKQMTDIEQETLIRNIISDSKFSDLRPLGKPDAYLSGILRSIDDAKREALTPEMVRIHAREEIKRIKNDEESISTRGASKGKLKAEALEDISKCEKTLLFARVYEIYEDKKREAKRMDFNDLIIELLLVLRKDELLLRLIQERYLYIHVDEHQDTNDAQNFILGIIAEFFDIPNIFIVGDEKQAIYRFQGASVENFLLLQKKWPSMQVISLDTNYRSHQGILDASYSMIEKNYEEKEHKNLRIELKSGKDDKPRPVEIVIGENVFAIESYLTKAIKNILAKEKSATVAVIVRRNRDLDRVIRLLESHDIGVSSERSVDIFSHPIGRLFFDLMEYLVDPSRVDMLARTVVSHMWSLDFNKSLEIVKFLKSGNLMNIDKTIPGLKVIQTFILTDNPISFLIHASEHSGFLKLITRDPAYTHVWKGIVALAESLVREGDIRDPRKLIEELLAYRLSAESRTVKVSIGALDSSVVALTAHGSKGLEFDHVFIPYATEEAWVGRARGASFVLPKKSSNEGDIRDTRRLFYVALTRARRHVTILTALEESDGKVLTPIRFIEEIESGNKVEVMLKKADSEEVYTHTKDPNDLSSKALLDLAQHILKEKGLSVTALNHFIECPNLFLFQSILKLPQAPHVSAEKGTAMHEAIDSVWKSEKKDVKDIKSILFSKIKEYFDQSLLSISEKELAKKELFENVSAVAKALESHFALGKGVSVFTESSVLAHFKDIPIHGKLDAIVDNGSEVLVFDYKTRQSMSVNAIKGETKNSTGAYFRQLVFYKMLLSEDIRFRGKKISPSLVFVSPDEKGRCPTISLPIEKSDIEKVKSEIQSLIDSVWSGEIIKSRCDGLKCEWCGMRGIF